MRKHSRRERARGGDIRTGTRTVGRRGGETAQQAPPIAEQLHALADRMGGVEQRVGALERFRDEHRDLLDQIAHRDAVRGPRVAPRGARTLRNAEERAAGSAAVQADWATWERAYPHREGSASAAAASFDFRCPARICFPRV